MKTKLKKIVGSILLMALFISFMPEKALAEAAVQLQALFVDQQYTYVDLYGLTNEGLGYVQSGKNYGFIDKTGQLVIPAQYELTSGFSEGLAAVKQNGKFGYINTKGEMVISGKYVMADRFKYGFAMVVTDKTGGKYGYIDKEGKEVIPLIYSNITKLVNGYAAAYIYDLASKSKKLYLVNTSGLQKEFDGDYIDIVDGKYVRISKNDEYTYYDFNGNQLKFANNKNAVISNGLMLLSKDGKYGYMDEQGNMVTPFDYVSAQPFDVNSIAIVAKDKDNYYGIDKTGKTVINPDNYTVVKRFGGKEYNKEIYYVIKKDAKNRNIYGCVNYQGNIIIPVIYESVDTIYGFQNGYMPVRKDGKAGLVDTKGNLVIPAIYEVVGRFNEGLAAVRKDYKWGFVNAEGKTVIPFEYDNIKDTFTNSMIAVGKDNAAGVIDSSGNTVIPFNYKNVRDINITPEGYVLATSYDGESISAKNFRYSLYTVNKTAEPTQSAVLVDGKRVPFEAFNIGGSNYFKLRDIAKVLHGSGKQVAIGWDETANSITITTGKGYTAVGGELSVSGNTENKAASITNSKILLNGKEIKLTAYQINGSNYFKLRDLAEQIDFGITWDESSSTIGIDTSTGYAK